MPENPIAAAGRCRPAPAALFISAAVRRLAPYRPSASYLSANTSTAPSIQPSSSPPASTHHEHERRRLANIRPPKQQCWTAAAAAAAGLGDASHRHSSSRTNATSTTTSVCNVYQKQCLKGLCGGNSNNDNNNGKLMTNHDFQ